MKKKPGRILVIDDDTNIRQAARIILKPFYKEVITEDNPQKIPFLLSNESFDVLLLDMNFSPGETSGQEGLAWLKRITEINDDPKIIMMTAYGQINLAVEAMKYGAIDFVIKPWENEKLIATVNAAYTLSKSDKELKELKTRQHHINQLRESRSDIIGYNKGLKKVFEIINKVALTDANILIIGENGTGKELIAKNIHDLSERGNQLFMKVDLGSITESLFESELFGHSKGAYTDAKEDRPGRFELASGGTLFLDEITNVSLPLQAKLLSTLQNREITRIGTNLPIPIDIRLISATNVDLNSLVEEHKFREDLLFRLNTVEILLPPLRERTQDIKLLANHFTKKFAAKYRKEPIEIPSETIDYMVGYSWPGNVRELIHSIERAIILTDDRRIKMEDLALTGTPINSSLSDSLNLQDKEKELIQKALNKNHGNMSKTAKDLGLGRTTLYRKIQKYGL